MRTTLTLDSDNDQMLREIAQRTRRPIKRVLNEALRSALLAYRAQSPVERFVVSAKPMGLRQGLDPIGFAKLGDDLEVEAFLDLTRKLERRAK